MANTTTTADPGVWVCDGETGEATDRKICAIGVQVRRGVTAHGIGLNVRDEGIPAEALRSGRYGFADGGQVDGRGYLSWGFGRIVACGLEGKSVTWLAREGGKADLSVEEVARVFAVEFARSLTEMGRESVDGVERIREEEVLG